MCWSRKGVPGSKRSRGAGTPFLAPGAEPNSGSERAAGSSDMWPPHERRARRPPNRRPAAGRPPIARVSWARFQPVDAVRRAAAKSDGRSYSMKRGRQTAGCSRSAGGRLGVRLIIQSRARTRSRLQNSTRSLAGWVPSRGGRCSPAYQAEKVSSAVSIRRRSGPSRAVRKITAGAMACAAKGPCRQPSSSQRS